MNTFAWAWVFEARRDAAAAAADVEVWVKDVEEDGSLVGKVMEVGSGAISLKTCFGSRNFGSMCFGARNSLQTTKISAETFLQFS